MIEIAAASRDRLLHSVTMHPRARTQAIAQSSPSVSADPSGGRLLFNRSDSGLTNKPNKDQRSSPLIERS
jgi:hypothetical protein